MAGDPRMVIGRIINELYGLIRELDSVIESISSTSKGIQSEKCVNALYAEKRRLAQAVSKLERTDYKRIHETEQMSSSVIC